MKRTFVLTALLASALCSLGCKTISGSSSNGRQLTLLKPADQTLRRGDANKVAMSVVCQNVSSEVPVRFDQVPDGVKIVEKDRKVDLDEFTVNFTMCASNEANLVSGHQVKVTAEGLDGLPVTKLFAVTVKD